MFYYLVYLYLKIHMLIIHDHVILRSIYLLKCLHAFFVPITYHSLLSDIASNFVPTNNYLRPNLSWMIKTRFPPFCWPSNPREACIAGCVWVIAMSLHRLSLPFPTIFEGLIHYLWLKYLWLYMWYSGLCPCHDQTTCKLGHQRMWWQSRHCTQFSIQSWNQF